MARRANTKRKPLMGAAATSAKALLTRIPPTRTPTALLSIASFCVAHGISQAFYFELRKQGLGPDLMKVGRRVFITHESAARWRQQREAASTAAE